MHAHNNIILQPSTDISGLVKVIKQWKDNEISTYRTNIFRNQKHLWHQSTEY